MSTTRAGKTRAKEVDVSDASSPLVNLRKQAKYALLGGGLAWYFQVWLHLSDIISGSGWSRLLGVVSVGFYAATIATFGYLMFLPARGVPVNYMRWQRDPNLQTLIPVMTAFIVAGYVTMVVALSPLCARSPPSPALSQRLLEAAHAAGGNLQKASSGIQLLLSDAARSIGLNSGSSSSSSFGSDLDVSSLLRALRLPDGEALAGRLGVSKDHTKDLLSTLERYQSRAQAWKENNVSVLGWTGAVLGSASAYAFMFGIVGLAGLFSPKNAKVKRAA